MRKNEVKNIYILLWLLCLLGSLALFPYIYYLQIIPAGSSLLKLLLLGILQSSLVFGLICWLSSKIVPKTDLDPFAKGFSRKQVIYPGLIWGISVGLVCLFLDRTVFASSAAQGGVFPPIWTGALASLYGSVNEEVLLRLFLFTLLYYLACKIFSSAKKLQVLWGVTILVSLLFGIGHLPAAFRILGSLSLFEVSRVLLLNGIPGIILGWLYWSRGLWTAIFTHFVLDWVVHVFSRFLV